MRSKKIINKQLYKICYYYQPEMFVKVIQLSGITFSKRNITLICKCYQEILLSLNPDILIIFIKNTGSDIILQIEMH